MLKNLILSCYEQNRKYVKFKHRFKFLGKIIRINHLLSEIIKIFSIIESSIFKVRLISKYIYIPVSLRKILIFCQVLWGGDREKSVNFFGGFLKYIKDCLF